MRTLLFIFLILGSAPLLGADHAAIKKQILHFDAITFADPGSVVREGTALYEAQKAELTPEEVVGLSVVIAESAGLFGKSATVWEWVQRGQGLIDTMDRPIERTRLYSLAGVALEFQGKSQEARASHQKAIATAIASRNLQMEAYALELYTYFVNREADYLIVVQNVKRLQEIYQQLPRDLAYYSTRAAVGLFFTSSFYKRYDEGIALIKESIAYFESHQQTFLAFNYSNSLAGVYSTKYPEEGIKLGLQLVEKYPETPDMPYPKYVYDSLGESYFKQQDYVKALHYFRLSAEFWQSNDNKLYYAELMLSVCRAYLKLRDYDKAWEVYEKISKFTETASLNNQQTWLEIQAELWRHRANVPEELKTLRRLLEVSSKYQEEQNIEWGQKMAAQFDLSRMEEQKRQLEGANQAKTEELERVARTQRSLILLSFLILLMLILALLYISKRHEAMEKQQVLEEVLDTIDEGIVRIGPGRRILPYFSKATRTFLRDDSNLVGQDILPILFKATNLTADQVQVIAESLNSILGESEDNWLFNGAHLPQQIKIGPRVLSLAWQPTVKKNKVVDLVLTIVDISRHLELEEAVRVERLKNSEFHASIGELRRVSLARSLHFLDAMRQQLKPGSTRESPVWWHTQKGIARTLGLIRLADAIHEVENQLRGSSIDLQALLATLDAYWNVGQEIAPEGKGENAEQDFLGLCREIFAGLRPTLGQHDLILQALRIEDAYQDWNDARLDTLREILVHAVTNSIDHGFVRSRKKDIRITLSAERVGPNFQLVLRDNGAGLNWDHLKSLARERGLASADQEGLSSLLFEDGVSTSGSLSVLSGRGLGLAAIRQHCVALKGSCTITDNPEGPGTELRLFWPESSWISSSSQRRPA